MLVSDLVEVANQCDACDKSIDIYNYLKRTLLTLLLLAVDPQSSDQSLPPFAHSVVALF